MKKILYLFILSVAVLGITSCSSKKSEQQTQEKSEMEKMMESNHRYDANMSRSKEDSATILRLAVQYLDLLKENKIDEALGMLYEPGDSSEVKPLSAKTRKVLLNNYKKYPVLSYHIDEFRLYSDKDTDVRFTFDFMEKPEGAPENLPTTMKGAVSPFRVNGTWYLTVSRYLVDTEKNDMENSKYTTNKVVNNNEDN